MRYELELLAENVDVIERGDAEALAWFASFGDSFRQILMNDLEHRKALEVSQRMQNAWNKNVKMLLLHN